MKASMWSSYLIEFKPEKMVDTFLEHGFECSELSDEHGWMILNRANPEKAARKFKQYCDDRGFSFPQGHFYLHASLEEGRKARRAKLMDDLRRWCDLFNALDVKAGVLHPASCEATTAGLGAREKDNIASALEELLEYSKGMSFTICLENLIDSFPRLKDITSVIARVRGGRGLGVCLDTGHLHWTGGDCAKFALDAGKTLKALHITDCMAPGMFPRQDHLLPFCVGGVDWARLMAALRKIRYGGIFNFEVPKENGCPMPIRLKKLDYVAALAEEMKRL